MKPVRVVLPRAAVLGTVTAPLTRSVLEIFVAPVTAKVLDNVALPVTAIVFERVVAPVTDSLEDMPTLETNVEFVVTCKLLDVALENTCITPVLTKITLEEIVRVLDVAILPPLRVPVTTETLEEK
jgi:hypothetical protein